LKFKNISPAGTLYVAGLCAVCVGVGAYDWRLSLIVGGAVLLLTVVAAAMRSGD